MYKFRGIILIFTAVITLFCRNCFVCYNTYLFLMETASITDILILKCGSGQTYPEIFEEITNTKLLFYKAFDFRAGKVMPHINRSFVDTLQLENTNTFFKGIGRRNLVSEIEYLKENKNKFIYTAQSYKEKYDSRKKADILYGVSVAVIISIVLI